MGSSSLKQYKRTYAPIWQKLKKDSTVSLTAPISLHSRINRAVQKEKWLDLEYKLEIEPRKAVLSCRASGSVLTFTLKLGMSSEDF